MLYYDRTDVSEGKEVYEKSVMFATITASVAFLKL